MKFTCIMPVGAFNTEWLADALKSADGIFDEIVMCVSAPVEFHPAVQNAVGQGVKLVVSYQDSIGIAKNHAIVASRPGRSDDRFITLDSDDLVDNGGMSELIDFIKANKVNLFDAVVYGQILEFGLGYDTLWPTHGDPNVLVSNGVPVCAAFTYEMWRRVGGFEHVRYEDWHFWKKLYNSHNKFKFQKYVTYHHRRWAGSISAQTNYNSNLGHNLEA